MHTPLRILLIGLLVSQSLLAQKAPPQFPLCATPGLSEPQRQLLERDAAQALADKMTTNSPGVSITYVPIRPHILRRSDGTGGMSVGLMNQVIAVTNRYYLLNGQGIQFYFCGTSPDYVDNDQQYASFDINNQGPVTTGHDVANALNQYYVNQFSTNAGGYAEYPFNSVASTHSFILNQPNNPDDMGNRLVPHELGHNFNLVHTFGERVGTGTLGSGTTLELVTRGAGANCTTEGDYLCDTPADPYNMAGAGVTNVNGCPQYDPASTARDANGQAYAPSVTNIMSYYFPCTHDFTPGQYARMQAGLALRQTHTAYSLDCPPTTVAAPTNVAATATNGSVVLTWQDNATNEMGYFVERATSAETGFMPVGGVGPGITTFTDTKVSVNTTYYYRIRPSNAILDGLSTTVSIMTPSCRPNFSNNCTDNDGLNGLTLNNTVLSQNSGCSPGGYRAPTGVSATVSAGQALPLSGTLLSTAYAEGVTIWGDLNRNGVYEPAQGEVLFQTDGTVFGSFAGQLTLPASTSAGLLSIRVLVTYSAVPQDPCGTYSYGEAEDYVLNVGGSATAPSADLRLFMQVGSRLAAVNQPVSYSVTVRNNGPSDATDVSWQNRLPAGLTFVGGSAGLINSGATVSSDSFSLAKGASVTFAYQVQVTQPGTFVNAAQILTSSLPNPYARPGSGTAGGQPDEAAVDFRTLTSGPLYVSPNPDQTPLPAVASNQPTPDSSKADLSLTMAISNRTPALGQPITLTLTVSNAGGLGAGPVVVRDTLWNLTLTNAPATVAVVATGNDYVVMDATAGSLSAGSSASFVLTVSPTRRGYGRNAAQVWSSNVADPDSTPGNGTANGEDDTAAVDWRVGP